MSEGAFDGLYKAKLRDNGIEHSEDDYKRFCRQLNRSFSKGILDLSCQRIGINILTKLTKVLRAAPHIRVFNFYGNLIRDHGIHSLLQLLMANTQVEVVDIGCNDLGNSSIPTIIEIIKSTNVKSLQLGATGVAWHNNKFSLQCLTDLINAMHGAGKIECLGLASIKMSTREGSRRVSIADVLADYINDDPTLKSVAICDCGFSLREEDLVTTHGLLSNERLKFLDYHSNQLADPVGPNFLAQLNLMTSLSYLDIHSCNLSGKAGISLAESLKVPSNLTILDISDNYLGDEGAIAIFTVLLTNQTLTELNIAGNKITENSSEIIGDVISENKVICSLNLSQNPIGDIGAYSIADTITSNDSITRLVLASCRMTDEGAVEITTSLAKNKTLKYIDLSDNFLTRECGYRIIDSIRPNEALFKLDVNATQIDHFVSKAIDELCKRNKQIQKETDLQPLKKQMVQLSIQRTKMPEAISRLQQLNTTREGLERDVFNTQEELDMTESSSNANILAIRKVIQSTKEMIEEEKQGMVKLEVDKKKMIEDYEKNLNEMNGNIEKEKVISEKVEKDAIESEQACAVEQEEAERKITEMQNQINQLYEIRKQILEVMEDPEKIKNFEPPQLTISLEPTKDKFFLNEEILDIVDEEKKDSKKKKKKGKTKKAKKSSKSPDSSRKRKKSPKAEAPAPAQETTNAEQNPATQTNKDASPISSSRNDENNEKPKDDQNDKNNDVQKDKDKEEENLDANKIESNEIQDGEKKEIKGGKKKKSSKKAATTKVSIKRPPTRRPKSPSK